MVDTSTTNPFSFTREQLATKLGVTPDQVDDVKMRQVQDLLNIRQRGFMGDMGQQFMSGLNRSMAGINTVAGDIAQNLGFEEFAKGRFEAGTEDLIQSIQQAQQDPELARRLQEATQSESFGEAVSKLLKDPKALSALAASSFGSMAPQVPAALGATVAGGPIAGAAVFGAGSGLNEYSSKIFELVAQAGLDPTNPEQVQALLQDEEAGPILRKRGALMGIPVAAFDALSYGLAGKIAQTGIRGGLVGETALQSALGMAGAAGGQKLEQGTITNYSDIAAEGILEAATAVPQAIIQPAIEKALVNREVPDISAPTTSSQKVLRAILNRAQQGKPGSPVDENAPTITEDEEAPAASPQPSQTTEEQAQQQSSGPVGEPLRPALQKKIEDLESGKPTERAVKQAEQDAGIRAPKEMLRGTPTQMRRRLNSLSTTDLVKRAVENAKIPEAELLNVEGKKAFGQVQKYIPKKDIIEKIFSKYGIDAAGTSVITNPKLKSETASPQPTPAPVKPKIPTNLDSASRSTLFKVARSRSATPEQKQQALTLLEAQESTQQTRRILNLAPPTPDKPNSGVRTDVIEAIRKSAQVFHNPNVTPERKEVARGGFVTEYLRTQNEVSDTGVKAFSYPNLLKKMNLALSKEDGGDVVEDMLSSPRVQKALLQELYSMYRSDPDSIKQINGRLASVFKKAEAALEQMKTPAQAPSSTPVKSDPNQIKNENVAANAALTEYEASKYLRDTVTRIDPFLYNTPEYTINDQEYRAKPYTSIFRHILQKYDWFRSMPALARRIPGFAGIYNTFKEQEAFRHNDLQDNMQEFEKMVEKYSRPRLDKALEVLDIMSRPGQLESQSLTRGPDGRIKFIDVDGKTKLADKATSDAMIDFSEIFRRQLAKVQQAIITDVASANNLQPRFATRENLMALRDKLLATKQDALAESLTNTVAILDQIDTIFRSNKAYFPHLRSRGPYAIAVYERVPESDKPILAGFYSVKEKLGGAVDEKDLRDVRARIQKDKETSGRDLVTFNGLDINTASPFYKNKNNIERVLRGGVDKALQYEIITSLLTSKAINPKEIEALMDQYQFRNNLEKVFTGLRQRKGYLGYDIDERLSSVIDALQGQTSALTTYKYKRVLDGGFAELERQMMAAGPTAQKDLGILRGYQEHMTSPVEDWATLKAFNFWYFLALNPSTAFLQLAAPFLNTIAWTAQYSSLGSFVKTNVRAIPNFIKAVKVLKGDPNGSALISRNYGQIMRYYGVGVEEAKVLSDLKLQGLLDPNFAIEAVGDINLDNVSNERTLFKNPVVRGVRRVASGLMEQPESVARMQTAFMVLDSLKNSENFQKIGRLLYETDPLFKNLIQSRYDGKITKEAIVRHAISENHADFGKIAETPFFQANGGTGALMFPFLKYPVQMLEQLRRLGGRGPRGMAAFAGMAVLYPVLFGGLMSLPGYGTWDWLSKWYQKLRDDGSAVLPLEQVIRDTLGGSSTASWLYMKGPVYGGFFGVDISNRLSYQFWFQPVLDAVLNPSDNPQANANQFLGGLGAILTAQQQASNQIAEGDSPARAYAEAYAPNPLVRNLFKASRIATGDVETTRGQRLLPSPEDAPSLYGPTIADEVVLQAFGLRPQALSEASTSRFLDRTIKAGESSQYSKAAKQYARFYTDMLNADRSGDVKTATQARQKLVELYAEIVDINSKSSSPKSAGELMQALRTSIRSYQEQELDPLALSRKNADPLKEAQRFGTPLIEEQKRSKINEARQQYGLPPLEEE